MSERKAVIKNADMSEVHSPAARFVLRIKRVYTAFSLCF
jgi:hypothetical protein